MRFQLNRPREGAPANLMAEGEVFFDADTAFSGLKLVGFSVWKSDDPARGDYYVTFPSRPTSAKGAQRSPEAPRFFDFLRAADAAGSPAGKAAVARCKNRIIATFKRDFLGQQ